MERKNFERVFLKTDFLKTGSKISREPEVVKRWARQRSIRKNFLLVSLYDHGASCNPRGGVGQKLSGKTVVFWVVLKNARHFAIF